MLLFFIEYLDYSLIPIFFTIALRIRSIGIIIKAIRITAIQLERVRGVVPKTSPPT